MLFSSHHAVTLSLMRRRFHHVRRRRCISEARQMSQRASCPVTVRNVTRRHASSRQRGSERDAEQPLHRRSTSAARLLRVIGIKLPSQSVAVVPFSFSFSFFAIQLHGCLVMDCCMEFMAHMLLRLMKNNCPSILTGRAICSYQRLACSRRIMSLSEGRKQPYSAHSCITYIVWRQVYIHSKQ